MTPVDHFAHLWLGLLPRWVALAWWLERADDAHRATVHICQSMTKNKVTADGLLRFSRLLERGREAARHQQVRNAAQHLVEVQQQWLQVTAGAIWVPPANQATAVEMQEWTDRALELLSPPARHDFIRIDMTNPAREALLDQMAAIVRCEDARDMYDVARDALVAAGREVPS